MRRKAAVTGMLLLLPALAAAQEFRTFRRIPARDPRRDEAAAAARRPVAPEVIEAALRQVIAAWNTPKMIESLGASFYDASRLLDALTTTPRDAKLRILAIESITTLEQTTRPEVVKSTVAAVVRTQVEYNDPATGFFVRREGRNEYIFHVTEPVTR